ncbi:HSP20-like chaperone [Corynespora cassiicola Philippines]|uniref:HSP20-like chaperone n=1 Tax=Corynespora cassiicola Philippines TaxID=1448308 RepID=A0A2T2P5B5_CORCC|nr:HSP20-like chaperone [Corynespora cassiicola Philippines]
MSTVVPEVTWAQRSSSTEPEKNHVFLSIVAADVPESDLKIDLQPTKLSFKGTSTSKKVTYAVDLEFFGEIVPEESKSHNSGRDVSFVLRKKELKEEYWPRLLKDNKKMHFLKTDFDKWVDEDEQDEVVEDEDYMSKMNPMGGAGGDGGFGGIDFSKLAAAQGAGGMPDLGNFEGGEGADSDDEDDDDMPELEEDDKAKAASASADKPKIEEVK